ncbi:unnamed protein product, partial [marine sediment metagenome]
CELFDLFVFNNIANIVYVNLEKRNHRRLR